MKHCPADTHPEGWGVLQHAMGQAHYFRGKQPNERYPHPYFYQARDCYFAALETLTEDQFKELRLKVVRDLVKVLSRLEEREAAEEWQLHGLQVLIDLINETPSPTVKNYLEDQFASFRQWGVEKLVRENKRRLALKIAELDKNRRLSWILEGRSTRRCPDWADIPRLFSPNTAAILYWHKSPDKLTTFILKPGEWLPRAVVADAAAVDAWIGEWDRLYREYGQKDKSSDAGKAEHPWRQEMTKRLEKLGEILEKPKILGNIGEGAGESNSRRPGHSSPARIESTREDGFSSCSSGFNRPGDDVDDAGESNSRRPGHSSPARIESTREDGFSSCRRGFNRPGDDAGIRHLILVPHRELHRLPLHALFPGYCCTYLPSLQMGLDAAASASNPPSSGILSIEHPNHAGLNLLYAAEMESHALRQMFAGDVGEGAGEWNSRRQGHSSPARIGGSRYVATDTATRDAVMAALQQRHRYLHFNGHASHEKNPAQSALYLSGGDTLTVADIRELDLRGCELAVLSACETGVTNLETVDAEYVGLASAFLKAGVRQVVSTLWTVQSDVSALLMLYFYRKVGRGCSASLALVKAIGWLRRLTDAKLERLYRRMLMRLLPGDKLAVYLGTELSRLEGMEVGEKKKRRFDEPYFWAAFGVTDLREMGDLMSGDDGISAGD